MVVDDQAFIRQVIGSELVKLGYEVCFGVDGADCVKKVRESGGGLHGIILDVMMPNLDGFEACRIIRQDLRSMIPIVFLSANSLKSYIIRAVQVGGNDYVVKDPDPAKLIEKINEHIGPP